MYTLKIRKNTNKDFKKSLVVLSIIALSVVINYAICLILYN